jgi:hypothetical protein
MIDHLHLASAWTVIEFWPVRFFVSVFNFFPLHIQYSNI